MKKVLFPKCQSCLAPRSTHVARHWLLRPAHAGDVVNYSDFMESINKGEVEMVRVQQDMLSAQYTTKDTNMRCSNSRSIASIHSFCFTMIPYTSIYQVMLAKPVFGPLDRLQDGSRREVNLIPNAQIEDQLFNQLADKKVDVVTCRSGWVQNYCRMCRHFGSPLTF